MTTVFPFQDGGPWKQTPSIVAHGGSINVTDLEPGKEYKFRVVSINGLGDTKRETKSDPRIVLVGPDSGQIPTDFLLLPKYCVFVPIGVALNACRAVIVIVSGSNERATWRIRERNQK